MRLKRKKDNPEISEDFQMIKAWISIWEASSDLLS